MPYCVLVDALLRIGGCPIAHWWMPYCALPMGARSSKYGRSRTSKSERSGGRILAPLSDGASQAASTNRTREPKTGGLASGTPQTKNPFCAFFLTTLVELVSRPAGPDPISWASPCSRSAPRGRILAPLSDGPAGPPRRTGPTPGP